MLQKFIVKPVRRFWDEWWVFGFLLVLCIIGGRIGPTVDAVFGPPTAAVVNGLWENSCLNPSEFDDPECAARL